MRLSVVVITMTAVGLNAVNVGRLMKHLPLSSNIHEKIVKAQGTIQEIEGKLGGAGQKLKDGLDKVKEVLATVDKFFQGESDGKEPSQYGAGGQNPTAGPNQYAQRDGSVAQVQYRYAPQDSGVGQEFMYAPTYGKRDASAAQIAYRYVPLDSSVLETPTLYSERDMSAAQVPYLFARRYLHSGRSIPYQYAALHTQG